MQPPASFLFATCNPGWEAALKRERQARHGEALAPAFLRPGLVTWKVKDPAAPPDDEPPPVFAHVAGRSLGLAREPGELVRLVAEAGPGPWHLHAFPRVLPGDGFTPGEWAALDTRRAGFAEALGGGGIALHPGDATPAPGDAVLDLITGDEGEPLFVGWHRHTAAARPFPGGMPRAILPADAPSRAWLKMEQALAWAGLGGPGSLRGKHAVELGSAPGGGSHALLAHGAIVTGIDTAAMDPRVLAWAGPGGGAFTHLALSAGEVRPADLPRPVELLASDMNLAPPVALRYIERLQRRVRARVLLLTLKINDARMEAQIPGFLRQVAAFAPGPVHATQLPANRSEITLLAARAPFNRVG